VRIIWYSSVNYKH